MKIITIKKTALERHTKEWPCNNLSDNVDLIVTCFSNDGSLVDYEACDSSDNVLDIDKVDSGFLSALFDDALNNDKPIYE